MRKKIQSGKRASKFTTSKPHTLRTLIVENSEDDALLIIRHLKKNGYDPVYERVHSAAAMKKALREKQWDIILCDYKMPKFNAPAAIALLKKIKTDIPILIVSGTIGEEKAIACMRSGAQDYIMKENLSRLAPAIARELKEAKVKNKQRRTEEKFHQEQQRFRILAEQSSDIIVLFNSEGTILYENPAVERILGFRTEERVGRRIFENVHPDDLEIVNNAFHVLFTDKNFIINQTREIRIRHRDGNWHTFEVAGSNLANNDVIEAVIVNLRDITERKLAEEALRASEEKFVKAFRYSPSAMCISTVKDGRYIDVNHAYLKTFGYKREEIIGRTSSDINLWVDLADRNAMIQGLTERGKVNNIELRTRDKQGNIHWLLTSASLIKTGGESYLMTQSMDVTDRKRAEDALKATNKQLQDIIEFLPDATLIVDKDNKLIAWNRATEEMTGIPKAAIIGRDHHQASIPFYGEVRPFLMDLVGMDDKELAARYSNVRRTGSAVHAEVFTPALYHNRGAYVLAVASPLLDDAGNIVGLIESIRDITERKQLELQRESALESLRKSEELYTKLVNSIPDIIIQTDLEGNVIFVNDKALHIGGYSREEMIGQKLHSFVAPEYREEALKNKQLMLENKATPREYNLLAKNGRKIPFDINGDVLRDEKGIPFGFVNVCRDISERKRVAKELHEQEERLQSINQNLPGVIYQFYARYDGEYGFSYISEPLDEFSKMIVGDGTLNLDTFFPSFVSRVCEEDREKLMVSIKTAVDTVSPWSFEGRVSVSSGGVIWFQGLSVPKRLDDRVVFNGILLNINERKLAEEKSRQSEEKFHKIFMTTPSAASLTRLRDGLLIDVNKSFVDIIASKRETVLGKKVTEPPINFWVNPSERELMLAELKSGKDVVNGELKFRRNDGTERFGVYSARTIEIDNEDCLIFILQDVTDHKLAEEKFRKIFMTSPDCIAITRLSDGRVADINKAGADMVGWKREEAIGVKSTDPPYNFWVDLSARDFMMEELRAGRDILYREFKFRRGGGSIRTGIYSARSITIDGEACLIFIMQDITERKQEIEKFYKIFMTTPDLVGITRLKDGLITDVNKGFEKISGWKREEAIGTKSTEPPLNFWVDKTDRELMVADMKAGRDITHREIKFCRKDGSIGIGTYSARPMSVDGEESLMFIMQDVTEQKRMEKDLALSEKMKLMGQLASGVAHEVRNPLHAIQAISEAMALDMVENSEHKDYLTHIKAQVARLSHLMNDLLELGKPIQSSQFSKELLKDIANTALRNWIEAHPQLSEKVKVMNKLTKEDFVLADANKIQQVIINLLENAFQHSPKDEEIMLELGKVSGSSIILKVVDKGTGIKSQDLPKVFEPFYTTSKGGTGLGLSLCRHIVESHGGIIEVFNNIDAPGCTAQFTLPVYNKEHK
ncbi:MAG: PAS domain S-box protein [Syntrophaceae bacterium]|nr:PAS domain S-box protein [Syntrophaceae bacterium]